MGGNARLPGVVAERSGAPGKYCWRVRLDSRPEEPVEPVAEASKADDGGDEDAGEPAPVDYSWPTVGSTVEALYVNGHWYRATVSEVREELDWYSGTYLPAGYVLNWS